MYCLSLSCHTTHTIKAERIGENQRQRRGASSGQKTRRGILKGLGLGVIARPPAYFFRMLGELTSLFATTVEEQINDTIA